MSDIGDIGGWDEVQEQAPLDALPAGPYTLAVIESSAEMNERAQGRRILVTYEVQTGPYTGRKGWDRFDIDRAANVKGEQRMIDLQRFKTLCVALGFQNPPRDTSELHGIPFGASAKVKQDDPNYAPKNDWGSYRPMAGVNDAPPAAPRGQAPMARPAMQSTTRPTAAGNGGRPAWPARQMPNR